MGQALRVAAVVAVVILVGWSVVTGVKAAVAAHPDRRADWHVLGAARQGATFYRPAAVAIDGLGKVYISDSGNFRILELSQQGTVLASWGGKGSRPGDFGSTKTCSGCAPLGPGALAVSATGTVYADDPANERIEAFSSRGRLLRAWKTGLAEPLSLAVDGRGNLLAGEDGDWVVTFSPTGKVLARWQVQDAGHAGVTVAGVAAGPRGTVYIAAWWPDSTHPLYQQHWFVQKLSEDGRLLASWQGVGGPLAADANGRLYVGGGNALDVLDPSSGVVARWDDRFASIVGVAIDRGGNVFVADGLSNRVIELSPSGKTLRQWGVGGPQPGRFVAPWDIGLAGNGDVYVDDVRARHTTIQRLSVTGKPLSGWAAPVDHGMGVDRRGRVYVLAYPGRATLREYSPSGELTAEWPLDTPASRVTADQRENVYLLAAYSSPRIEQLRDGRLLGSWELPSDAGVVDDAPIAVDTHGRLYVVQLLPSLRYGIGKVILGLGGRAAVLRIGRRSWPNVSGLAVDRRGSIYLVDHTNNRIEKLSSRGTLLARWGGPGAGVGRFHEPAGIAVDAHGDVYVADSGNSRLQRLGRSRASRAGSP